MDIVIYCTILKTLNQYILWLGYAYIDMYNPFVDI